MGSDFADIVPGAVWHQLRRIRVTDIQLGSKRLMQCTVLIGHPTASAASERS